MFTRTKEFLSSFGDGADGFVGSMELVSICELCAKLDFSAYLIESRLSFDFVESSLITALKEGNWVILENIHAASSDVIERLNSLTEESMTLNLFEKDNKTIFVKNKAE
ncbi:unnamed protein product, partial [Aduncisulcus paluster]